MRSPRRHTAFAGWLPATALCVLAGVGPAAAQTSWDDLEKAVPAIARQIVSEANLRGQRVLVTPYDFFEEGTKRRLPLSETLSKGFRSALLGPSGVEVVVDAANPDEMMVLQGEWTRRGEGVDLTVWVRSRSGEDHVLSSSTGGHVRHVAPDRLESDWDFLGRHVVRALERPVRDRRRRKVHVGDFSIIGAGQEDVRAFLEDFWLRPAFAGSGLFQLVSTSSQAGRSDGELRVKAWVGSTDIRISLMVRDTGGRQVSATTVKATSELLKDILASDPPDDSDLGTAQDEQESSEGSNVGTGVLKWVIRRGVGEYIFDDIVVVARRSERTYRLQLETALTTTVFNTEYSTDLGDDTATRINYWAARWTGSEWDQSLSEDIHGRWKIGERILISISVPLEYVEDADDTNLRLCVSGSDEDGCYPSPNLLTGIPEIP